MILKFVRTYTYAANLLSLYVHTKPLAPRLIFHSSSCNYFFSLFSKGTIAIATPMQATHAGHGSSSPTCTLHELCQGSWGLIFDTCDTHALYLQVRYAVGPNGKDFYVHPSRQNFLSFLIVFPFSSWKYFPLLYLDISLLLAPLQMAHLDPWS